VQHKYVFVVQQKYLVDKYLILRENETEVRLNFLIKSRTLASRPSNFTILE
jgi:hypothetical protein